MLMDLPLINRVAPFQVFVTVNEYKTLNLLLLDYYKAQLQKEIICMKDCMRDIRYYVSSSLDKSNSYVSGLHHFDFT